MEPISSDPSSGPVDGAQIPVADSRDQGQRHGMGDVRADDPDVGSLGYSISSAVTPMRAGADRGDRDQHADHEAEQIRQPPTMWRSKSGRLERARDLGEQPGAEDQRDRGQQQREAERGE
jgi:hypothetical protein